MPNMSHHPPVWFQAPLSFVVIHGKLDVSEIPKSINKKVDKINTQNIFLPNPFFNSILYFQIYSCKIKAVTR